MVARSVQVREMECSEATNSCIRYTRSGNLLSRNVPIINNNALYTWHLLRMQGFVLFRPLACLFSWNWPLNPRPCLVWAHSRTIQPSPASRIWKQQQQNPCVRQFNQLILAFVLECVCILEYYLHISNIYISFVKCTSIIPEKEVWNWVWQFLLFW